MYMTPATGEVGPFDSEILISSAFRGVLDAVVSSGEYVRMYLRRNGP